MGRRLSRREVQTGRIDQTTTGGGQGRNSDGGGGVATMTTPTGTGTGTSRSQRRARAQAQQVQQRAMQMIQQANATLRNAGLDETVGIGQTGGGQGQGRRQRGNRGSQATGQTGQQTGQTGQQTGGTTTPGSDASRTQDLAATLLFCAVAGRDVARFTQQDWVTYTNQAIIGATTLMTRMIGFRGYSPQQIRDRVIANLASGGGQGGSQGNRSGGGQQQAGRSRQAQTAGV